MKLLGYALLTLLLAALATFVVAGLIEFFLRLIKLSQGMKIMTKLLEKLEKAAWLRVFKVLEPIGILIAVVALILTLLTFQEEREARAWSLIFQSRGSPGDGGRNYALEYLHNKRKVDLTGLPLEKAYLKGIKLPKARLDHTDLQEATLIEATLIEATLIKANLSKADLSGANLRRADLHEAYLLQANLDKADLSEANLDKADLLQANLFKTSLRGASLRGADLTEADLGGADLTKTKNLKQEQIDRAFYCEQWDPPKLPVKLKPPPTRKCDKFGNPIKE